MILIQFLIITSGSYHYHSGILDLQTKSVPLWIIEKYYQLYVSEAHAEAPVDIAEQRARPSGRPFLFHCISFFPMELHLVVLLRGKSMARRIHLRQ